MEERRKVFGVGMSKTGTKTLRRCFEILGLTPSCSYHDELKKLVWQGRKVESDGRPRFYDPNNLGLVPRTLETIIEVARGYRTFDDSPWYMLFRELDQAFPCSLFILTVRDTSLKQAESTWWHNVAHGTCAGAPSRGWIADQIARYDAHNAAVEACFAGRRDQLITLCWETGDEWRKLCAFLGLVVPRDAFPHMNVGIRTVGTRTLFRRRPGAIMSWLREAGTPSLATFRLEVAGADRSIDVDLPASFGALIESVNASTEPLSLLDMMGKLELSNSLAVELAEVERHVRRLCEVAYLSQQDPRPPQ